MPTEQDAINTYLAEFTGAAGERVSYLEAGLRDAREARGKALWLATIGYLITVEQIGHTIALPATAGSSRSGSREAFVAAWGDFGNDVDEAAANILYSMRCALAHKYGLQNEPKNKNQEARVFAYTSGGPLLVLPATPWDRSAAGSEKIEMTTRVNIQAVCDQVEALVGNARSRHADGEVVLAGSVTPDEVQAMLTFRTY